MLKWPAEPNASWYVHVPFCARKCSYCAFYSEASSGELINRYVAALVCEMELLAADLKPQTIFFGGGTPSLLNLRQWEQILRSMDRLDLLGAAEWTVECNPATVSLDKARLLRSYGVNRVSMGVQSLEGAMLERLGRVHSRGMVFKSFDVLRKAGIENINLDLMFAIPGQTMDIWSRTLNEAIALGSEHLSCYEVIYEEDTPLYAQLRAGQFAVDEDQPPTFNPQGSTLRAAPAVTTSTTGAAAPSTGWGQARPVTCAAYGQGIVRTPSSTASKSSRAIAPSSSARNSRRWLAPVKRRLSGCA